MKTAKKKPVTKPEKPELLDAWHKCATILKHGRKEYRDALISLIEAFHRGVEIPSTRPKGGAR